MVLDAKYKGEQIPFLDVKQYNINMEAEKERLSQKKGVVSENEKNGMVSSASLLLPFIFKSFAKSFPTSSTKFSAFGYVLISFFNFYIFAFSFLFLDSQTFLSWKFFLSIFVLFIFNYT